ncbi:hypothetical protein ACTXT7_006751 [Hymenolepis weldensis]
MYLELNTKPQKTSEITRRLRQTTGRLRAGEVSRIQVGISYREFNMSNTHSPDAIFIYGNNVAEHLMTTSPSSVDVHDVLCQ